ncbi:hypothetical protein LCR01_09320 [Companilactobacillus crustorum]|uniref:Uncharacterized protein n=3 Tax=Companilactobacillus TaxID=2767879 RepID=A0A837RJY8_9LACO|nr:YtxH domain-containing protein [Companilactobacillus crustorum]HCD06777.1 YtxH domain-containing protein [Lactobacillus sp.]APU70924.1 hypothetical protein BI355_0572 [Companilactobacillus crustorum]KRK42614.1 hypothetical protein FD26_GL000478 [Companilactobacillus crustorum JCM 15951]KRO20380.1 hypothetical protein IV63_GL000613 [Companilactobacillus crustorum]WDT66050.1 YtxH domain-containing protein [Companilactobacillus crustorum]
MKNNHFLLGLVLGCASGYIASKYLTSESGQKLIENVKTIRGDFNNGGVGLNTNSDLIDSFNEKTDALKDQMASTVDKIKDDDEDNSDIVFNEDDLNKD